MTPISASDSTTQSPRREIVSASAGSGKTHALAQKLVQLLLSDRVEHNKLRNILAVTFTNNAAMEMRHRTITMLKKFCLGDPNITDQLAQILDGDVEASRARATNLVNSILDQYSDFQVMTIDSFMSSIITSSAVEFGFPADFTITLDKRNILDEALDEFSRQMKFNEERRREFEGLIAMACESGTEHSKYLWDPYSDITRFVSRLSSILASSPFPLNPGRDRAGDLARLKSQLAQEAATLKTLMENSGFDPANNALKFLAKAEKGDFESLLKPQPISKPINKSGPRSKQLSYDAVMAELLPYCDRINALVSEYALLSAESHYRPSVNALFMLEETMMAVKKRNRQFPIEDVGKQLSNFLDEGAVPDVYLRLGETIYHYLIDEFQDTSPMKWRNLSVLIENALSLGGSLFVVGDTKQSIFSFGGGDQKIMKKVSEPDLFRSAPPVLTELPYNRRSGGVIVDFVNRLFTNIAADPDAAEAAAFSGLNDIRQEALPERRESGYVETRMFDDETLELPERDAVIAAIGDCRARGYGYKDIAILSAKNARVVEVSSWLNSANIPFVSYSSLDIRRRKVAGDILSLLNFLDSPVDDLSFATFVLGDVFLGEMKRVGVNISREELNLMFARRSSDSERVPYYKLFQQSYADIWNRYFEDLFNLVGYLPLYDLVSEIYKIFRVFDSSPGEEASLVKFLDLVKTFEDVGANSLKDFLSFSDDESSGGEWDIAVPKQTEAVTVSTIHKAKGLGFKVVIVLLYVEKQNSNHIYTAEQDGTTRLLRVTKELAARNTGLLSLYDERKTQTMVESLNVLYVALTRAEEEMYVFCVGKGKDSAPAKYLRPIEGTSGTKSAPRVGDRPTTENGRKAHHVHVGERRRLSIEPGFVPSARRESERGELLHEILSEIEYWDDIAREALCSLIDGVCRRRRMESDPDIERLLGDFLASEGISRLFERAEGRVVMRERDCADDTGRLRRIDRLVVDGDVVTVVDFKTGIDRAEYDAQVRAYMKIARDLFPGKKIRGMIALIESRAWRMIE